MAETGNSILIVEDDLLLSRYYYTLVRQLGYEVCGSAQTADEAVALALGHLPGVILMDVRLPGDRDGIDAANEIHGSRPETKIVYITGSGEPETINRINQDHPAAILMKPIAAIQLQQVLGRVLH